jgi:adenylate kinase family enzyme
MVVIAIAGPSTSGKTTLTDWLCTEYSCTLVELDAYFLRPFQMPRVLLGDRNIPNWDVPQSLAWAPFLEALTKARNDPIVIVEGFILFADPAVAPLCDALITLKFDPAEKEVAMERRVRRETGRAPPSNYRETPFASRAHLQASYFESVVWPEMMNHPEYTDPPDWCKPRLVLSATADIEGNMAAVADFLKGILPPRESSQ